MTYGVAVMLWIGFLIAAVFYTRQARHPDTPALAGYLIFVLVFTASSAVLFAIAATVIQALGQGDLLARPVGIALFMVIVFVPAFLLARWQLRKAPYRPRRP